jgi:hypothetical protein
MGNLFASQSFDFILRVILVGFMKKNEATFPQDI